MRHSYWQNSRKETTKGVNISQMWHEQAREMRRISNFEILTPLSGKLKKMLNFDANLIRIEYLMVTKLWEILTSCFSFLNHLKNSDIMVYSNECMMTMTNLHIPHHISIEFWEKKRISRLPYLGNSLHLSCHNPVYTGIHSRPVCWHISLWPGHSCGIPDYIHWYLMGEKGAKKLCFSTRPMVLLRKIIIHTY